MFDMIQCGRTISQARKKQNMTQMELADRMGISFQAVSNWERGVSMPDISKLLELSEVLGITVDEILGKPSPLIETLVTAEREKENTATAKSAPDNGETREDAPESDDLQELEALGEILEKDDLEELEKLPELLAGLPEMLGGLKALVNDSLKKAVAQIKKETHKTLPKITLDEFKEAAPPQTLSGG